MGERPLKTSSHPTPIPPNMKLAGSGFGGGSAMIVSDHAGQFEYVVAVTRRLPFRSV
jgi:hypothetical protein